MPSQKHLLHVFPTFAVGGSQMRFAQLAKLHAERYRHTVIALDGDFGMAERLDGLEIALQKLSFDKQNIFTSWERFRKVLHAIRPDILMTYNWGSMDWALVNRLSRRPIRHIHIEDGFGPEEAARQLRRRVWARRFALSGLETDVILPSRKLEHIAGADWKLPRNRLHYVPNGIDCRKFSGTARNLREKGAVVIGTVATLRKEKNIARLIKAFLAIASRREAEGIKLIVVGDGPERPSLERLARSLPAGDRISFVGQSLNPAEWLQKMDIFAISSDTEQMPLGVLEAMASGLPVVATAVGDIARMVSEPNADLVVPAGDAFEQALTSMINDPVGRLKIGEANVQRAVALFDETKMAMRYSQIIG